MSKLEWLLITEEQRSPRVDDDVLLTDGKRVGVGNNHSGTWEVRPCLADFEDIYQFTPTHYMPLNVLPPMPKETTDAVTITDD
jgi:hypothetical protein